ncbi:MAG: hypothetical protein HY744_18260 [Deltaproteobacteria bacterium]|nr:hypothetical protein [Deltaproteobacteria bacterium]
MAPSPPAAAGSGRPPPRSERPPASDRACPGAETETLRQALARAEIEIERRERALSSRDADLESARRALQERDRELQQRGHDVEQAMAALGEARSERDRDRAELDRNRRILAAKQAKVAELGTEIEEARKALAALGSEHRQLQAQHESLLALLAVRTARVGELESQLDARLQSIAALESKLSELAARAATPSDDLQRIRGLGPVFARRLEALGVQRLDQIAAWSEADIERFAAALKVHPARIRRASWVEQAARLLWEVPGADGR